MKAIGVNVLYCIWLIKQRIVHSVFAALCEDILDLGTEQYGL